MTGNSETTYFRVNKNKHLGDYSESHNIANHVEIETIDMPHVCALCGITFSSRYDLKKHHKIHIVSGDKPYQCNKCNHASKNYFLLEQHMKTHTSELPYKCNHCSDSFKKEYQLASHITVHTGKKTYQCNQCEKGFSSNTQFQKHLKTHIEYMCSLCDKTISSGHNLLMHIESEHSTSSETPYQCCYCDKPLNTLKSLKCHFVMHTGESPYQCSICDKGFLSKAKYVKHMEYHKEPILDIDTQTSMVVPEEINKSPLQTDKESENEQNTDGLYKEEGWHNIKTQPTCQRPEFDVEPRAVAEKKKQEIFETPFQTDENPDTRQSTNGISMEEARQNVKTEPPYHNPELDLEPRIEAKKKKQSFRSIVRNANMNVENCESFSQAYALACLSEKGDAASFQRIMKQYSVANNLPVVIHPKPDKDIIDFYSRKILNYK